MNRIILRVLAFLALLAFASQPAHASEPLPGDTCTAGEEDNFLRSGGKEIPTGHFIVCKSGTWRSILSWDSAAAVTKIGNLTCTNDQILKFNGTTWACAADSGGTLPTLTSANIWVGNGSNAATAVAMSGDATLSNAGVLTIANNAIGSAEITNASIALADLSATGTASATTYLRGDNTWASVPSGADNLGNHTATMTLALGTNWLNGDSGAEGLSVSSTGQVRIDYAGAGNTYDVWIQGGSAASTEARNLALLGREDTDTLYVNVSGEYTGGTVIGGVISGNGSGLTALNAANLASGTIPAARLPAYTGDVTKAAGGTALTIAANVVTTTEIAANTITAADIATDAIDSAELKAGAVDLGHLSATGTKSSSTFLRGDNTWAAPAAATEPAGSWCGLRQFACTGASTVIYYDSLWSPFKGGSSFACKGANITATCNVKQVDVVTCPSGYAGARLGQEPLDAAKELYTYTCRKT